MTATSRTGVDPNMVGGPYTPTWNEAYVLKLLLSYAWLGVMTLMVEGDECK